VWRAQPVFWDLAAFMQPLFGDADGGYKRRSFITCSIGFVYEQYVLALQNSYEEVIVVRVDDDNV
jgi:hypothetical protein